VFVPAARELVTYALGLGLLAIGIEIAWPAVAASADTAATARRTARGAWLLTAYFVALWLLWVAGAIPLSFGTPSWRWRFLRRCG
jgi:hypothetical protein